MKCGKLRAMLPDMVSSGQTPAEARLHLEQCPDCKAQWEGLQSTMRLLEEWHAPEPSPYFDTRMAVRLREAKAAEKPGWLERIRARFLFDSNLRFRPAMAMAVAVLAIAGVGSYEGYVNLHASAPQQQQAVSATVHDLELLDSNARTLQQLAAFEGPDSGTQQTGNGNLND